MKPHIRNYPYCLGCGKKLKDYRSQRCYKCNIAYRVKDERITKKCLNCGKNFTRPKAIALVQNCCKHQCGIDYWFKMHRGRQHPHFKENNITYSNIHSYIIKEYGYAPFCVINDSTCTKNIEWANIFHKKKNDKFDKSEVIDFIPLCESHHVRFDKKSAILN